jgi:DNA repair exonuclease SbcCD ATPase subunit
MGRAGVLYSDVQRTAQVLFAELGDVDKVTVDRVRARLGTGSKGTIGPYLKRWKESQRGVAEATLTGLPAPLVDAVKALYERMQAEFAQQLGEAQQEHAEALRAASKREEQQRAAAQAIENANAALTVELDQTLAAVAQLQAAHHAQSVKLAGAEAENVGLRQRLADRVTEVETLDRQLSQARVQFEHYQEATAAQRAEERQGYERRIARLEQDLAGAQHHAAAQQATIGQQDTTIAHLTAGQERTLQSFRAAQEELAAACTSRDRLAGRLEDETAAKEHLATQLGTMQQHLADVRAELAGKVRENEMLGDQLHRAEERANEMADEKGAWLQERGALEQRVRAAEQRASKVSGSATTP